MIGILNVNPCVDKTVFVDKISPDGIIIPEKTNVHSGGKGVNVARVLKNFGIKSVIFSVTAGENGSLIERLMREEGLSAYNVRVSGMSRVYTTVMDREGNSFALKERGPDISSEEKENIKNKFLKFLGKISFLCISDTIACKNMTDFASWAITKAKEKKITVFADTDGEALKLAIEQCPDIVKPNDCEISEIIGKRNDEREYIRYLVDKGIPYPIVSLGDKGCLTYERGKIYRIIPPRVKTVSAVGCGDSFIGGLIYGIANNFTWLSCLKTASASGAVNAMSPMAAYVEKNEVEKIVPYVTVKEVR